MNGKDISEAVAALQSKGAPDWFLPAYIKLLTMGHKLDSHLADHEKQRGDWRALWRPVASALLGALVFWLILQVPQILAAKP